MEDTGLKRDTMLGKLSMIEKTRKVFENGVSSGWRLDARAR